MGRGTGDGVEGFGGGPVAAAAVRGVAAAASVDGEIGCSGGVSIEGLVSGHSRIVLLLLLMTMYEMLTLMLMEVMLIMKMLVIVRQTLMKR